MDTDKRFDRKNGFFVRLDDIRKLLRRDARILDIPYRLTKLADFFIRILLSWLIRIVPWQYGQNLIKYA